MNADNFQRNEKQYAMENGVLVGMKVICDEPLPVLCREEPDIEKNKGMSFQFGDRAFISDGKGCASLVWPLCSMELAVKQISL